MKQFRPKIIVPLLVFAAVIWIFREPIQDRIREQATLSNDAPSPEVVTEMIERSRDPQAALLAAWNSGGIIHREVAMDEVRRVFPGNQPLPPEASSLLLSAAFDPDMNVRELAFGILRERHHPALLALAAGQLLDVDPAVRLFGLQQFKSAPAAMAVPVVAPLLDDPDTAVVGFTVKLLEGWAGQDFGMKLKDTVQVENETTGLLEFRGVGVAKTMGAKERAKAWWIQRQSEFPPTRLEIPAEVFAARQPLSAGDFQLRSLDGKSISLSQFRGKVVLLNFWTTWCTACLSEMPELITLQKTRANELVIVGVSLDCVPDEDGEAGGETADKLSPDNRKVPVLEQIHARVVRTVAARGINYPVILDEKNSIGGRFNGGELPTTVIVDAKGNVRRRFVGARSLAVFEAMIKEASQDSPSVHSAGMDKQTALAVKQSRN